MSPKSFFLIVPTVIGVLYACTESSPPVAGGGDAGPDPRYNFSPHTATRACGRDDDCTILAAITDCGSCCSEAAVARGEAERAHAAVSEACAARGRGFSCAMACTPTRPACYEGVCVALPAPDPSYPGGACVPDGGAPSDGGAPLPDLGGGPSCGARPVQSGFEDGLDPSWNPTDPAAFRIDRDEPVAGGGSLRISYQQKNAYLTIEQPNVCAVRIAFTLRTRLLASGITLARILVGEGQFFHLRLDGCALSVSEEIHTAEAFGLSAGGPMWPVEDGHPIRVVLSVDLRVKNVATAAAPLGAPLPTPLVTPIRNAPSATEGIRAVELGSSPGIQSAGVGAVWLDDLVID